MTRKTNITTLITDADNTLYSWVDYIVPSLEAMVETLARNTGFERDKIVESIKRVFEKQRTNEYAFALQEADIFAELRRDFEWFKHHVVDPARYAFARSRCHHRKLYPGVRQTLHQLVDRGVKIIVLSDAPAFSAEQRIKHLGIDHLLSALYALRSYPLPRASAIDQAILNRIKAGYYRSRVGKVVQLPLRFEKPSLEGIQFLLAREKFDPERTALVGDNPKKDIKIAQETGILDIWARYGAQVAPEIRKKLNYYSAPSIQKRNVVQEGETVEKPTFTIDRFDEILDILGKED